MKTLIEAVNEVIQATAELLNELFEAIERNLRKIVKAIELILPFALYIYGKGHFEFDPILLLPLLIWYLAAMFDIIDHRKGRSKYSDIPVPINRFTFDEGDGEISIKKERLEELLLYMGDLEDWLEKKKLINKS